jgi:hypothetical protein
VFPSRAPASGSSSFQQTPGERELLQQPNAQSHRIAVRGVCNPRPNSLLHIVLFDCAGCELRLQSAACARGAVNSWHDLFSFPVGR